MRLLSLSEASIQPITDRLKFGGMGYGPPSPSGLNRRNKFRLGELYDQQFQKVHRLSDLKNEGRYVACLAWVLPIRGYTGIPLTVYPGLQIRGLKFQSSNSNSRELELTNLLGLVLGCIEAKFCK